MSAVGAGCAAVVLARAARRAEAAPRARALGKERRPGWLPARRAAALAVRLARADLDTTPEEALTLWGSAVAAASVVAAAVALPLALIVAPAGLAAGPATLHLLRHRRAGRVRAAVPGLLEDVASDLRSGGTVATAVRRLADAAGAGGVGAAEMATLDRRLRLGLGMEEALAAWAGDHEGGPAAGDVRTAAGVLSAAASTGGRAAGALDGTAAALRDRLAVVAEVRALSAQGRWSAVVVGCLPVAALVPSLASGGGAAHVLLATGSGRTALVLGLALDALGAWWMHRIVRAEP